MQNSKFVVSFQQSQYLLITQTTSTHCTQTSPAKLGQIYSCSNDNLTSAKKETQDNQSTVQKQSSTAQMELRVQKNPSGASLSPLSPSRVPSQWNAAISSAHNPAPSAARPNQNRNRKWSKCCSRARERGPPPPDHVSHNKAGTEQTSLGTACWYKATMPWRGNALSLTATETNKHLQMWREGNVSATRPCLHGRLSQTQTWRLDQGWTRWPGIS